jgi:hypothetical protein
MKKSISTPSLFSMTQPSIPNMRRNISANALPDLTIVDAIIVTKSPIYHGVQCLVTSEFPEKILSKEVDKDFIHCLVTPYEIPEIPEIPPLPWERSSVQNESYQEKYAEWLRRIRRGRRIDYSSN